MSKQMHNETTAKVLGKIKSGKLSMRPRAYFTALTVLAISASVFASLALSYLLSIVFFWVRIETADTMAYGARANLQDTLASFPWWAAGLAVILLVAVVWFIRQYGGAYRQRLSTTVLLVLGAVLLLAVGMSYLGVGGLHDGRPDGRGAGAGSVRWQRDQ